MRKLLASLCAGLMWAGATQAATIAGWEQDNGASLTALTQGTGVTSAELVRGAGVRAITSSSSFNSSRWQRNGTKNGAINQNDYIEWSFTSSVGYDLTALAFGYDRNNNGPTSIAVDLFIDGVLVGEIFRDTNVAADNSETASIDLSAYDNVTNAAFRLYGWNAATNGGRFAPRIRGPLDRNAILLSGDLSPIPLPASLPLLVVGLAAIVLVRRRRRA